MTYSLEAETYNITYAYKTNDVEIAAVDNEGWAAGAKTDNVTVTVTFTAKAPAPTWPETWPDADQSVKDKFAAWKDKYSVTDFTGNEAAFLLNVAPDEVEDLVIESIDVEDGVAKISARLSWGEGVWYNNFMRLYHGSQNEVVMPRYGLGQDQHDFGRGFYLTDTEELAKEWAVYKPKSADGWVHAFDLDVEGLRVLDYRNGNVFAWIAELMRHRDADESAAYRRRAPLFIEKYGVKDADDYDVVIGWRANASYFYIVKAFVRGEIDLGKRVSCATYHEAYENRDAAARRKMYDLIEDPEFNRLRRSFNDLIREG